MKKQQNKNKKSKKSQPYNGNLTIRVHSQVTATLDNLNLRKIDIAILPSNFDIFNRYAATYQRYRILNGSWKFYALRNVRLLYCLSIPSSYTKYLSPQEKYLRTPYHPFQVFRKLGATRGHEISWDVPDLTLLKMVTYKQLVNGRPAMYSLPPLQMFHML